MGSLLGIRLRAAREAKRLTQVQVKKLTNINNKTLSGYEKGVSEPDVATLITLANLYGTSVDYLVGNIDEPNPHPVKKERPCFQEYILSAPTLEDAARRIAELQNKYYIDRETFLRLSEMAYDQHDPARVKRPGKTVYSKKQT